MTVPIVYDVSPTAVELKAGEEYYWCQCGRSSKQPFCDGSHSGTDIAPLSFSAKEDGTAYLCQCKQSRNPPYCDGSHKNLQSSDIGNAIALVEPGDSLKAQPTPEEPTVVYIHDLAENGLSEMGHHGAMGSMGVPRNELPQWDDIQLLVALAGIGYAGVGL